jgi:hypothetical protein
MWLLCIPEVAFEDTLSDHSHELLQHNESPAYEIPGILGRKDVAYE